MRDAQWKRMWNTISVPKTCAVLRASGALGAWVFASGLVLSACDRDEAYVPASPKLEEIRDQAGLHPADKRPAGEVMGAGGQLTESSRELREKAGLHPVSGEDYAETPEELRERLRLHPDQKEPPQSEAEMRDRMGLHPKSEDTEQ